jgi:hypothetical protein
MINTLNQSNLFIMLFQIGSWNYVRMLRYAPTLLVYKCIDVAQITTTTSTRQFEHATTTQRVGDFTSSRGVNFFSFRRRDEGPFLRCFCFCFRHNEDSRGRFFQVVFSAHRQGGETRAFICFRRKDGLFSKWLHFNHFENNLKVTHTPWNQRRQCRLPTITPASPGSSDSARAS